MFSEELYADFTAFWLLAHASRFGKIDAEPSDCPWERWRDAGQEAGVRARDRLRDGVAEALRALGTGFLRHPANSALRARIPTEYMPAAPTPAAGSAPATTSADPREQMQQLMKDAGFVQSNGAPSAEVMEKMRTLAQERGITMPTMNGGRGGAGGRGGSTGGGAAAVTNRTVYRLVSPLPNLKVEAVSARLGITDGIITEVISGLEEGDVIVTNIIMAAGSSTSAAATSNPFAGGRPMGR